MTDKEDKAIYKVMINAPIDTVWAELIKTDAVLPFFFGAICRTPNDLEVGAPIAMESKSGSHRSVVGRVVAFEPPRLYAHTFKFTGYDDPPCTVTYELKEVAGGVEFSLTTTNVPAGTKTSKGMAQGGPFIVQTFKSVVETGKPAFGARMMLAMIGLTAPFAPKASKSANWSFEQIQSL